MRHHVRMVWLRRPLRMVLRGTEPAAPGLEAGFLSWWHSYGTRHGETPLTMNVFESHLPHTAQPSRYERSLPKGHDLTQTVYRRFAAPGGNPTSVLPLCLRREEAPSAKA